MRIQYLIWNLFWKIENFETLKHFGFHTNTHNKNCFLFEKSLEFFAQALRKHTKTVQLYLNSTDRIKSMCEGFHKEACVCMLSYYHAIFFLFFTECQVKWNMKRNLNRQLKERKWCHERLKREMRLENINRLCQLVLDVWVSDFPLYLGHWRI